MGKVFLRLSSRVFVRPKDFFRSIARSNATGKDFLESSSRVFVVPEDFFRFIARNNVTGKLFWWFNYRVFVMPKDFFRSIAQSNVMEKVSGRSIAPSFGPPKVHSQCIFAFGERLRAKNKNAARRNPRAAYEDIFLSRALSSPTLSRPSQSCHDGT